MGLTINDGITTTMSLPYLVLFLLQLFNQTEIAVISNRIITFLMQTLPQWGTFP
jgi:hypothetical protein